MDIKGKILRYFGLGSLAILELYGCWSLYNFLGRWESLNSFPLDIQVPLSDNLMISYRLVISALCFAGLAITTLILFNRAKVVDLLVDTETEVKKVTWPAFPEAVNSTIVVLVFVLLLGVFIVVVDILYATIFENIF